jgi:MFS family permease
MPKTKGFPLKKGIYYRVLPKNVKTGSGTAISVLSLAELLAMSVWFSASAVVPVLTGEWRLSPSGQSWLTMAVQLGFVFGAFGSAVTNLADRIPAPRLFSGSAFLAAILTVLLAVFSRGIASAAPLRFLAGMALAGVYPVGMKIMATRTRENRGWGIGVLVGALTVGSVSPHLITGLGGVGKSGLSFNHGDRPAHSLSRKMVDLAVGFCPPCSRPSRRHLGNDSSAAPSGVGEDGLRPKIKRE